jgi:hypothetical protein
MRITILTLFLVLLGVTGCTPLRPVVYPNAHYQEVGEAAAQADINDCMQRGDQFVKTGGEASVKARDAAVEGAKGAVFGGAVGAVGGAIGGNPGEAAAVGAAGGATAGVVNSLFGGVFQSHRSPDPIYGGFVNQCLAERGYQVLGWQ